MGKVKCLPFLLWVEAISSPPRHCVTHIHVTALGVGTRQGTKIRIGGS